MIGKQNAEAPPIKLADFRKFNFIQYYLINFKTNIPPP